jgi:hypothetical protein
MVETSCLPLFSGALSVPKVRRNFPWDLQLLRVIELLFVFNNENGALNFRKAAKERCGLETKNQRKRRGDRGMFFAPVIISVTTRFTGRRLK